MKHTLFLTGVVSFLAAAAGFLAFVTFPFSAATFFTPGLCAQPKGYEQTNLDYKAIAQQFSPIQCILTLAAAAFLARGAILPRTVARAHGFSSTKNQFGCDECTMRPITMPKSVEQWWPVCVRCVHICEQICVKQRSYWRVPVVCRLCLCCLLHAIR